MKRSAGILMHISSLPSKFGIGTLGSEAYKFANFLKSANQKYWQILPIGPTGFGDSPYQSFSTFAGNPYFIDLDLLKNDGLLNKSDYENIDWGNDQIFIDYKKIYDSRFKVLKIAFENFKSKPYSLEKELKKFISENLWIEKYSLFMALKKHFNMKSFLLWPNEFKNPYSDKVKQYKKILKNDIEFYKFIEFLFFKQWNNLKNYVNSLGIKIIGDIPIYVGIDSSDVFFNKENFLLDNNYFPEYVSGCPQDSLSPDGQIWGNPLYNWNFMKKNNYQWWINRIEYSMNLFDVIRIDHFRGFESFFCIPSSDKTAKNGFWKKGPGIDFFNVLRKKIPNLKIIAEDLGFLTQNVKNLLNLVGFPGMKVLEFAFDSGPENDYLPHNFNKNCIAYTSTHDCNTIVGWLKNASKSELQYLSEYINKNYNKISNWDLISLIYRSISNLAIIPMQDVLSLDENFRMNIPSTLSNNWRWRINKNYNKNNKISEKLKNLTRTFGRV